MGCCDAPNGVASPQVYSQLLALYLYQNDLCNAKYLWKRIPQSVKASTPELANIWAVGQHMWKRDFPAIYKALEAVTWSDTVGPIMKQVQDISRSRAVDLISQAYSSIHLDTVSAMSGLPPEVCIPACAERGWKYDADTRMIHPIRQPIEPSNQTSSSCFMHESNEFNNFRTNSKPETSEYQTSFADVELSTEDLRFAQQKSRKHKNTKNSRKKLAAYRMGVQQILSTRKTDTYDPQSLGICSQLLTLNPDIYTLWNYRKEYLHVAAKKDEEEGEENLIQFLENELRLTEQCLLANPKSYGSWHHRYWVLMIHPKPNWENEFSLCTKYLTMDDRNFHVWDYRRLIINKIGISLTDELKFSTERLNANFSNYSSWHYRSTLRQLDEESIGTELSLVQNAVFTDPADSSAWFYFRWVLSNPSVTKDRRQELLEAFEQLEELDPDCKWIIMAKCWLTGSLVLNDKEYVDRRVQFYKRLAKLDPLRKGQYEDYLKIGEEKIKNVGDQNLQSAFPEAVF
ncbi:hypothetical protein NQ318_019639 [Aromia moschata]|uniref:Geranylgeranyl transferase type-2 subunit alpha n=1 Tax=Aromia moschata TaxID=1265417 RepID=A0AAV8Z5U6_9CUCU|nr:hypothetical protein NQ318_019639 [Aromia moschata]